MDALATALEDYLAGEAGAFDRILRSHQARLCRYAARLVGDVWAAQDAVQETFLRLLQSAPTLRRPQGLSAWLYRTCRNLACDQLRHRLMEEAALADLAPRGDPAGANPVSRAVERRERLEVLRRRFDRLTARQRACICLKLFDGRSYKEISRITGLSVSAVGVHIHEGLKKLAAPARTS